jgi:dTDP-4-dehydrorhamnose reductase
LGQALCALPNVVGLDRAALDIAERYAVGIALERLRPCAVINAAAKADVDRCESDWPGALRANAEGPGVLAVACATLGLPLVHVSTDYVFGGEGHACPRRESDPPAPVNAYGRSKLLGEQRVLDSAGNAVVVRTAWLFGFAGDFLDRMRLKALAEGRLRVTEQAGTPSPVAGVAEGLHRIAIGLARGLRLPPIIHLAGAPIATRAEWVAAAVGCDPAMAGVIIDRVGIDAFPGDAAVRPLGTPLDTRLYHSLFGAPPDWRRAL